MAFRLIYHLPGVAHRIAKESLIFRRLLEQCPDGDDGAWVCFEHPAGGTVAVWPGAALEPPAIESLGDGILTADGLTYFPSHEQPDLEFLLRSEITRPRDGCWVTLSNGRQLWVAVASISEIRYALIATGERRRVPNRHRYGILARELMVLYNQRDPSPSLAEVVEAEVKVVVAAIHASYQVTDEAITDIEALQLTRTDMDMVLYVALGNDPKGYAAALRASLCSQPAAESLTYPSQQESGGASDNGHGSAAMDHG